MRLSLCEDVRNQDRRRFLKVKGNQHEQIYNSIRLNATSLFLVWGKMRVCGMARPGSIAALVKKIESLSQPLGMLGHLQQH